MKLVSYLHGGAEVKVGLIDEDQIIDLAAAYEHVKGKVKPGNFDFLVGDMTGYVKQYDQLLNFWEVVKEEISQKSSWIPAVSTLLEGAALTAPLAKPGKIICIGLNYRDHAKEGGNQVPREPVIFGKYANAIIGTGEAIRIPPVTGTVDYEAELAVVIGKKAYRVDKDSVMDYIFGFMNFNDVSARDLQKRDGQWMKGKFLDTFAPTGPYLVTKDEIDDPMNLKIELRLNRKTMQSSNTGEMVFSIADIVSFLSQMATLEPGDIIATGTPAGCGYAHKPPVFMKAGDVVEVEIAGLGILQNHVVQG